MDKKFISSVLTILNKDQSINDVKKELQLICRKRRGKNRLLTEVIISFLEEHLLPFRVEDNLTQYELQNIPSDVIASLEQIVLQSQSTYFNATCGEYLWTRIHKLLFADLAVKAYYTELDQPSYPDDLAFPRMALGICRIISKYKVQPFPYDAFLEKCITHIESHIDDNDFCNLFVYEALISCEDYSNAVQKSLEKTISYYEQSNNHSKFIAYSEVLKALYESIGQHDNAHSLISRIAEAHESKANQFDWTDPKHSHMIIAEVQEAMNEWRSFGGETANNERKRLAKRIEPVKRLMIESMQTIKAGPMDIRNSIAVIQETIDDSTFEQTLQFLTHLLQLESKESLKNVEKGLFTSLFSTTFLDSKGRKRYILPPYFDATENEKKMIMEHDAARRYSIGAEMFIVRAVSIAKDKYVFSEDTLRFIVENNAFIPDDRRSTFLKGLVAGFHFDFQTAMSVLMPQVENAVRELAVACGAVVFKTNDKGIEECLSMERVLAQPEVVDCLEETFLFNLHLFYVSEYGFGMRNLVSHGLLSDAEINGTDCLAVWWFTLRVCCTFSGELKRRLRDQHDNKSKHAC